MLAHQIDGNNRTQDVMAEENVTFESLLLSENVLKGLTKTGFKKPSPIQLKAIPIGRCGFDLIVKSKSGTGKTLIFSVIALESLKPKTTNLEVLILAPAREIAVQVQDVIKQLGFFFEELQVESFIGGLSLAQDKAKCKNCNIAVGTPGRIKHLISENLLNTVSIKLFVLDEADKLLEESFLNDINEIYNSLPSKKQIIATSATYPNQLNQFLSNYMLSPTQVSAEINSPLLLGLKQFIVVSDQASSSIQLMKAKNDILCKILTDISFTQCLIFTNYQMRAESLNNLLNQKGWASTYISAAQKQEQRLLAINSLKDFKCRILLSTDLTARGIDAANVDLVINYDIPNDTMTYLHRMGRAGRYGSMGICINLTSKGPELVHLQEILGSIGGSTLTIPKLPTFTGSILDLLKIEVPSEEHVTSIVNTAKDKTVFNKKMYEDKPESKSKGKTETKSKKQKVEIINTLSTESSSEIEDVKKRISDMEASQILDSLLNQNFKLKSSTEMTEKDNKPFDANAVMELLSQNNPKDSKTASNDAVQKKVSEEEKKEMLLLKNKALLKVSQILNDTNAPEEEISIKQHVNFLKTRDKNEVNKLSKKSLSDILNILEGTEDISKTEERVSSAENILEVQPSTSKTSDEKLRTDLENIFQFGHDQLVYSNDDSWKEVLENIVKAKHVVEETHCEEEEEYSEDDVSDDTEPDYDKVNISKQIPKYTAKKLDKEQSAEAEQIDETKWLPVKKPSKPEFDVVPTSVLEARKNSNEYEDYDVYFNECSENLWQNGLSFDNAEAFDEWFFYEWETQLYGIRNCVQQSIYLNEMAKFQNNQSDT